MPKPLRISILGKEYTLRVDDENEEATLKMAGYLNDQLNAFKAAHPEQSDLTASVITALAVTEKLFNERNERPDQGEAVVAELDRLEKKLTAALT